MRKVQIGEVEIEVIESTMRKTRKGVTGAAKVRMNGRTITMSGTWEDPYKACREPGYDETGATIDEHVNIDGHDIPSMTENSVAIRYVRADGVEDQIDVEEIAEAIAE